MKIGSEPHDHADMRFCAKSRSLFPTNCFIEELKVIAVDGGLFDYLRVEYNIFSPISTFGTTINAPGIQKAEEVFRPPIVSKFSLFGN
jgi:hypothetical protein